MKINKLYKLFTLTCLMFCFCNITMAQTKGLKLKATVVDKEGNPISGVIIYAPNGDRASSGVNGTFEIVSPDDESLFLEKSGYVSKLVNLSDLSGNIILEKTPFLTSKEDEVKMGVATKNRREMVGAVSTINPKDRLTYDNTQWVRNYINGLMLGVRGSDNIRGIGSAIFVIDGVIGRDPNILNMEEVEQITVLKDANAVALYGSQARNGVIVINTKRGQINRKEVKLNVRSGFNTPIALPNYLSSAAYMQLFNEALDNDGAAANDGRRFSNSLILNTKNGINKFKYPDIDLYSNQFVQPFTHSTSIITEFSGGNEKNQYYINAGWNTNSAWVDINEDINAGTNRFNVRGNIDFRINDWITSSLDGIAIIRTTKSSRADLLDVATTLKPNAYSPFLPVSLIDTSDPTVAGQLLTARQFSGNILGTSTTLQNNAPIALAIAGGYRVQVDRATQFNNSINFNLDKITKGLSAKTYLSFDFYDSYNLTIENQFKTYAPDWTGDKITSFGLDPVNPTIYGEDLKDLTENVSTNGFVSRFGFYGLVNYQKTIADKHSLNTTLLAYYNSQSRNNVIQKDIDSHFGFQVSYDYKKKVYVDFTGTYAHSIKLPEGNRGGLSPTVGLAYVLSEESFLKDNDFVNYLKIKASGGVIKSDAGIGGYYLYDENYSQGNNFNWADGLSINRRQNLSQGANPNLGFEERIDLNIGVEAYLMNSFWLEANYFKTELDKQITFLADQYPSFYNTFRPYNNFNKNLYTGFELGMNYNKTYNDFSVTVGANVLYSQTERVVRSEVFTEDYLQTQGREISTIFGLVDQGFYGETDFSGIDGDGNYILNNGLPVPNFGSVQPGDIKYVDQNNDNVIDNDDRVDIGQSSSPLSYGINLNLKYKAFNLFILGTGQTGGTGSKLSSSFNNYYGVNGNDKYSEVVIGRWTPATANTATFPRLSANENINNFRPSTFWMYDTSFFNINRAQLTYEFDDNVLRELDIDDLSINLSGTNLFEISKNKNIRQLRIGTSPLTRTITFGLRASF